MYMYEWVLGCKRLSNAHVSPMKCNVVWQDLRPVATELLPTLVSRNGDWKIVP